MPARYITLEFLVLLNITFCNSLKSFIIIFSYDLINIKNLMEVVIYKNNGEKKI